MMQVRKGKLKKFTFSHTYILDDIVLSSKILNVLIKFCIYSLASFKYKILNIILDIFNLEGHYEY
jgi:hypothetical protein